ncbi:hypothetical protein [Methanopyrus sp. SNP6]|uniref:hypothetical protein n=1 Tax=Methanopyrus sp. SNP6 TaxID=1937005 RepID=UPI0011E5CC66|nr:hypothetical protein [Methanopyrus sp. SNP6]
MAIEIEDVNEVLLAASLSALKELGETPHTIALVVRSLLEDGVEEIPKEFLDELKETLHLPPGSVQSRGGTRYEIDNEDGKVTIRVESCSWKSICELQEEMGQRICPVAIIIDAISETLPIHVEFDNSSECIIKAKRVRT